MDIRVYKFNGLKDDQLLKLLNEHDSFIIDDVPQLFFSETIETLEKHIDNLGMKSRVYSKARKTLMAGSFFGPTALFGVASAAFMGAHNLVTYDPDYEIGKNRITGTLTVTYKK
ncbi:MAG: hypothetical protein WEA82_06610 [Idiomarina sp.]